MQISKVGFKSYSKSPYVSKVSQYAKNEHAQNNMPVLSSYSAENVKANFIPSFGIRRNVGQTKVSKRDTGRDVAVSVKNDPIGDYSQFGLYSGREKLGYLDLNNDSAFPYCEFIQSEPSNIMSEVKYLRTIAGDKYSGIGTALIKTAIQESYNKGNFGNVFLISEKGYQKYLSPYRSNENPIPFYYKMGFVSPYEDVDNQIRECIANHEYDKLPESTILILSPEARDKWLSILREEPVMKFKDSFYYA